jgi:tRNA U34 5-carboxymethylaminomethyl modifying GTPase MnmE/TrmE
MALDIRLYHFGMITGQVTNDELGIYFANFCIGSKKNTSVKSVIYQM